MSAGLDGEILAEAVVRVADVSGAEGRTSTQQTPLANAGARLHDCDAGGAG